MQDFKRLSVWQKSHRLTLLIYQASRAFPAQDIAEGCGRGSLVELKRFLYMSMGSACEVEYFLCLARDLGVMTVPVQAQLEKKVVEVKPMRAGLIERLKVESLKN